jgi:hypothetical protein
MIVQLFEVSIKSGEAHSVTVNVVSPYKAT